MWEKELCFQTSYLAPYLPAGFDNLSELEAGEEYILFEKGSPVLKNFVSCMEYIIELVKQKIGWKVKSLKIIYANPENHRAYWMKKGKKKIYVLEADRLPDENIILSDVLDAQELKDKFEAKYNEVMRKADNEWKEKLKEFHSLDKSTLDPAKKEEYKKEFKSYKREVHDTLELVDFKYTLYHERWLKLSNYKDYQFNNYHEIPNLSKLNDEEVTDELISRGKRDMQPYTDFLTKMVKNINKATTIRQLCEKLDLDSDFYYPINMMRKFVFAEIKNTDKATLKIGPLKTKDRGLQKVIETKDKTTALLDVLRSTILCKDPVVPLLVIEYLEEQGMLTRVKNKTLPVEEYKCVHINFTMPGDWRTIYELQIVFEEYYELQKKDHDYYELIRVM
jgi:hypothetical protein